MKHLPEIHAVWVGSVLGPVERACLTSFVRHGHRVTLHCYGNLEGVPKGIGLSDGEKILPASEIFRHREPSSLGMFADIFRFELFAQKPGSIYVDCDVYCLKPIEASGYLYGLEDAKVNGAVLALPADSDVLKELREMRFNGHKRWEWERRWPFAPLRLHRHFRRSQNPLSDKLWALTGPFALSHMTKKHKVKHLAKPAEWFYPVHFRDVAKLFIPGMSFEDVASTETRCIHLYNETFKAKGLNPLKAPATSIIGKILASNSVLES